MSAPSRIVVDAVICERTGYCVRIAPAIFTLPADGGPPVIDTAALDLDPYSAAAAEIACPTQAIITSRPRS